MKLKRKCKYVLSKNDSYDIALVGEYNLLVEWFSWIFATVVAAGCVYLYLSIVQPEIITFLFG